MLFCCRNVDDVHNLMDEIAESHDIANEIGEAISNPVGFQQDIDEVNVHFELCKLLFVYIVSFFCKCCHFLVLLKNVQVRKQTEKNTVYVIETG